MQFRKIIHANTILSNSLACQLSNLEGYDYVYCTKFNQEIIPQKWKEPSKNLGNIG